MTNKELDAQKQALKNFLQERLTRAERLIVVLHYYDEMTVKQIAEVLQLSESRVSEMRRSIIARCKSYVRGEE